MGKEEKAFSLWKRVDDLKGDRTLQSIADEALIKYQRIKEQRSSGRIPTAEDLYAIARALNTSIEFLLTGENFQEVFCAEARAVNEDPELQALVRAVMKDRRLLSALASVITSMEHASAGLA